MKTVNISIDYDEASETPESHEIECLTSISGKHYHDSLVAISVLLLAYDMKKTKRGKEAQELLTDIRKKCAIHFRGLYHER